MRSALTVLIALGLVAVAACEKSEQPTEAPPTAAPDPDAPAPGTQAAEAIGLDAARPKAPPR